LEGVVEVGLGRVGADVGPLGDVSVGVAEREQLEDLDLARGEGFGAAISLLRGGELFGERHDELRIDHHVAARHQTHGLDQMFGVARFEHVTSRSASNRFDHELAVVVGGEHDHADVGELVTDLARRFQPIHLGHPDVDERDLGRCAFDQVEQLLAVGGLADDLDPVGHVEVAT